MLYICIQSSKQTPTTNDFATRDLANYTVARASDVGLLGKPNERQIAYSGYATNIECFLYATATKSKVSVKTDHVPLPVDYTPTFPCFYPRTIFSLAKKPTADALDRMFKKLEKEELVSITLGGGPAYLINKPSYTTIATILPQVAKPTITYHSGYSQVEGSASIVRVYQCIEAFLATNTYSYKKEDSETPADTKRGIAEIQDIRQGSYYIRDCWDAKAKKPKYNNGNSAFPSRVDEHELQDLTPSLDGFVAASHLVMIAKPSPLPSSTSWGAPRDVPNKSGILFPYFPGMMAGDPKHIRDVVGRRFFRNLGTLTVSHQEAYKAFRKIVFSVAQTAEGVILSHVLCGVDLALDTQAQLYLLFDGGRYQGFVLLGSEFKVFIHGNWHAPLASDDLREELNTIATHDTLVARLASKLAGMSVISGDGLMSLTAGDIDSPLKLVGVLSRLKLEDVGGEDAIDELSDMVGRLAFPGTFLAQNPENIAKAVNLLTTCRDQPLPSNWFIFIPRSGWAKLAKREYQVLSAFGSRSISFRNSSGPEYRIPRSSTDDDPLANEAAKKEKRSLIVFEKPISNAVTDWLALVESGMIRVSYTERALGCRATRFGGDSKDLIWRELKAAAEKELIGVKKVNDRSGAVASSSSISKKDVGTKDLGEFF